MVAIEDEQLFVRWYHRYEMELFLEKAGFSQISIWDISHERDAQATLYQAFRKES